VLDFGCGFGLVAAHLAPHVSEMWLWDPASNMRNAARRNTAHLPNVQMCDLSALEREDTQRAATPLPPMDVILVNSVVQYMTMAELSIWLGRWRELLARDGRLVLSDLIPTEHSVVSDTADLLMFGARHRAPMTALGQAVGGVIHYLRMRQASPLTRIGQDELAQRAAVAGLSSDALPANLTHLRHRWTAILTPRLTPESA
jgi:ubiquinone/menaquinone biosynthesis C-methylase UbiE